MKVFISDKEMLEGELDDILKEKGVPYLGGDNPRPHPDFIYTCIRVLKGAGNWYMWEPKA